jgi:hypothetical protein
MHLVFRSKIHRVSVPVNFTYMLNESFIYCMVIGFKILDNYPFGCMWKEVADALFKYGYRTRFWLTDV